MRETKVGEQSLFSYIFPERLISQDILLSKEAVAGTGGS